MEEGKERKEKRQQHGESKERRTADCMTNNMKCRVEAENAASGTSTVIKMEELVAGEQIHTLRFERENCSDAKTTFRNPEELRCKIVLHLRMDF